VAIRPSDIQGSIWQASHNAPLTQRAQEAPRAAQAVAQAAFASQAEQRSETVAQTHKGEGNRVGPDADGRKRGDGEPPERRARSPFAEVVDEAAGLDEPPHLIDYTA
jgi:hypothetical protein